MDVKEADMAYFKALSWKSVEDLEMNSYNKTKSCTNFSNLFYE